MVRVAKLGCLGLGANDLDAWTHMAMAATHRSGPSLRSVLDRAPEAGGL